MNKTNTASSVLVMGQSQLLGAILVMSGINVCAI